METTVRQRRPTFATNAQTTELDNDDKFNTAVSHGWGAFCAAFLLALTICGILIIILIPSPINPVSFSLKERPALSGALSVNTELSEVDQLYRGHLEGPESLVADGDHLYTGTADGRILDIFHGEVRLLSRLGRLPCGGTENEPHCGRPLGMRMDRDGYLVVVDAYLGLYKVNVATGDVHQLYSSDVPINGERPKFLNDLDIGKDGTIYISDSSTKWTRREHKYCVLEGESSGRVMAFNSVTKEMKVLFGGISFANGVQLSADEDFLLVCETTKSRIWKYWLKGENQGRLEVFIDNLPGFPDNIRRNPRGMFWVGMAAVRYSGKFSMLDFVSDKPWIRSLAAKILSLEKLSMLGTKYGLIIEVDKTGNIVRSFHDPIGSVLPSVSEIEEKDGVLYLGSYDQPYLSRLRLRKKR